MARITRRRLAAVAVAAAAGTAIGGPVALQAQQQPPDIPGAYARPDMLPGAAGPYSALAGTDPAAPLPAAWRPRAGVAALPALPPHLQRYVDEIIAYYPAPYGFTRHAYGWPNRKAGTVQHIPVCRTLMQLRAFFLSGQNQGLTHLGIDRALYKTLDLTATDGAVWRAPFAAVDQYCPLAGEVAPWAQGRINTSGSCAVPPHPVASRMASGEPNGAYISFENVAWAGTDGMTDPQFNSNVFGRAMVAAYFGHPINHDTQVWHAGIDRIDRCFDTGWPGGYFGGLEVAAQAAARAVLAGDFTLLRGAVRIAAPPTTDWRVEAWQALIEVQERNDRAAVVLSIRQDYDRQREAAIAAFDPTNWDEITLTLWAEMAQRARWDEVAAAQRRADAEAQLRRLS